MDSPEGLLETTQQIIEGVTYTIKVYQSKDATETAQQKILRLLK